MATLTNAQKEIAGSFHEIVEVITSADAVKNYQTGISFVDQRNETYKALATGAETEVYFAVHQGRHYLYFPNAERGAVCVGGQSEWTDCRGMDDLEHRYDNFDELWSN